jgi:hypothetical protein
LAEKQPQARADNRTRSSHLFRTPFKLGGVSMLGSIVRFACLLVACALLAVSLACFAGEAPTWAQPAVQQIQQLIPTPAPADQATAAAASDAKPAAATRGFKKALGDAAGQAYRDGQISRWQLARLRMAIAFRPEAMAEAQACVIDQAVQDGLIGDAGPATRDGFDWSGLLAFLKEFLPMILQIIAML